MERFGVEVALAGNGSGDRLVTVRGELDLAAAQQLWESLEPLLLPGVLPSSLSASILSPLQPERL